METLELQAEVRKVTGKKVKHLREEGLIPAVLYGQSQDAMPLQIEAKNLHKVLAQAGTHQLIALKIGKKRAQMSMARDIQRDPVKRDYLHVDFYAVNMDRKITAEIPLVLEGKAPAVDNLGGILTHSLTEVEVECLPKDLISAISVDIEGMVELNDTLTVADLKVPSSITILSDPEMVVAKIEPPRAEEELEALEEEAAAEPKLITRAREGERAKEPEAGAEEE